MCHIRATRAYSLNYWFNCYQSSLFQCPTQVLILMWGAIMGSCWSEAFWRIHTVFVIFSWDGYFPQGWQMLLPIAWHGPYCNTCWYSDKFVVLSVGFLLQWPKNSNIPFCEKEFSIWISPMTHYGVNLDFWRGVYLEPEKKSKCLYAIILDCGIFYQ